MSKPLTTANRLSARLVSAGALALALIAVGHSAPALARQHDVAASIEADLARGDTARAIQTAENAVAAEPRDAQARAALGRTYIKAGRYASAVTALNDAVALGETSNRTLLSLALANIATGHDREAVGVLDQGAQSIPPADLGLAMALAGDTARGVTILADAVRAGDKSDKLRANLAYAYALDGRWGEARNLVAMDLPADKVDARMTEWAAQAKPEGGKDRVIALLGVPAKADNGMPTQLALANGGQVDLALATAQPPAAAAPEAPVAVAAAAPAAAAPAVVDPNPAPLPAPVVASNAGAAPVPAELPPVAAAPAPAPAPLFTPVAPQGAAGAPHLAKHELHKPKAHRAAKPHADLAKADKADAPKADSDAPAPVVSGTHMVQLGSFSSETNAQKAKVLYLKRDPSLKDHDISIAKALVNGKTFWRLSAAGFAATQAADKCHGFQKKGYACMAYVAGHLHGSGTTALARR